MTSRTIATTFKDTWTNPTKPAERYGSTNVVRIKAAPDARYGWLRWDIPPEMMGQTVHGAKLMGRTLPKMVAQTYTLTPVASHWAAWSLSAAAMPTLISGQSVTRTPAANAAGGMVDFDIAALMQAVADGQPWYGVRISTNSTAADQGFWSAESGQANWEVWLSWSDEPAAAANLTPNGGIVTTTKPMLAWEAPDQVAVTVNVYAGEDDPNPVWTSGWIDSPTQQYDMAASTYPGATSAWWDVTYRGSDGEVSVVSDRASWTGVAGLPVPVLDSPLGGTIGTATPLVAAHLSSGTIGAWQVLITGADRSKVYGDSGRQTGPLAWRVPATQGGKAVLAEDRPSQIGVLIWDDQERAATVGTPTHVELWTEVTWDEDAALEVPTDLRIAQVGDTPLLRYTWRRGSDAAKWQVQINDKAVHEIPAEEVTVDAGRYSWTDRGQLRPYRPAEVRIAAIEADDGRSKRSAPTWPNEGRSVTGVWLIPDDDDPICLSGLDVEGIQRTDAAATYTLADGTEVDVIYGRPGYKGELALSTDEEETSGDVWATLDAIERLARRPYRPGSLRLVWASMSLPVRLRSLQAIPSASMLPPYNHLHNVRFGFIQDGDSW